MGTNTIGFVVFACFAGCNFAVQGVAPPGEAGTDPTPPSMQQPAASDDAGTVDSPDLSPTAPAIPTPPGTTPAAGALGDACDAANPCAATLTCFSKVGMGKDNETRFTSGYCSVPCSGGGSPCPGGSQCATFTGGSICVASCNGTCRTGYSCCKNSSVNQDACLPSTSCD